MRLPHNSELSQLIGNLTGNEKSYFKKLSKRHSSHNNSLHVQLFDILEQGNARSDEEIMDRLGVKNASQYSTLKLHLLYDLLDSLAFMRRKDDIGIQLNFLIAHIETLVDHKLPDLAGKLFKKTWEIAAETDSFNEQIRLTTLQLRMLELQSYKEFALASNRQMQLMNKLIRFRFIADRCEAALSKLIILKKQNTLRIDEKDAQEVELVYADIAGLNEEAAANRWTSLLWNTTMAVAEHFLLEFDKCQAHSEQLLLSWQQHPKFIALHPKVYLEGVNTMFYNCFARRDISGAAQGLKMVDALTAKWLSNEHFKMQWAIIAFNTELKIYHKTARYDDVERLISERSVRILNYASSAISKTEKLSIMASIAISHFVTGNFGKADELCIEIKEMNHELKRDDIMYFVLIFHILVLYERREWYRLDNAAQSAYHLLYSRKKLRPFEKELILFLKRLPGVRFRHGFSAIAGSVLRNMRAYINDPTKKMYFLYFNYYAWLESKVRELSYREYMEEQRQLELLEGGSELVPGLPVALKPASAKASKAS